MAYYARESLGLHGKEPFQNIDLMLSVHYVMAQQSDINHPKYYPEA